MTDNKYVIVYMVENDLYADQFETYEDVIRYMEEEIPDNKAYIVRIEEFCADHYPPIKITLEPHT